MAKCVPELRSRRPCPGKAARRDARKSWHTVCYDRHILGGTQYSQKIEQELAAAGAVIVLWSERSLSSAWVRDEAAEGKRTLAAARAAYADDPQRTRKVS